MSKSSLIRDSRLVALERLYEQVPKNRKNYESYLVVLSSIMDVYRKESEAIKKKGVLLT